METKNNRNKLESIRKRLQFQGFWYVDPLGLSGGLALWWTSEVSISVFHSSKNVIAAKVTTSSGLSNSSVLSSQFCWLFTCVYADPIFNRRIQLWNKLLSIGAEFGGPWMCIGDFNEVSSIWEKQGGREVNSTRMECFNKFVSDGGLIDLEFKGINYTWTNKREGVDNIRERINKAFANTEWRLKFPLAQVFHEPIAGSDHAPLLLNCCVPLKKVKRVFKFESMWTMSPNCKDVISRSWCFYGPGSDMFKWSRKLKNCKNALKNWSREEFGNNKTRLAKLKSHIFELQMASPSPANIQAQKQIINEMEEVERKCIYISGLESTGYDMGTEIPGSFMLLWFKGGKGISLLSGEGMMGSVFFG